MIKFLHNFYDFDCHVFRGINRHFEKKALNLFFRTITHAGGATFTICTILFIFLLASSSLRYAAIASGIALTISHIPVSIMKKFYPRKRPYLALTEIKVATNPLKDHSFPSGHTTAIFSAVLPFILYAPMLAAILLPLAISVGISRMYLGLHYPSDVAVGCILGTSVGCFSYLALASFYPYALI